MYPRSTIIILYTLGRRTKRAKVVKSWGREKKKKLGIARKSFRTADLCSRVFLLLIKFPHVRHVESNINYKRAERVSGNQICCEQLVGTRAV